MSSTLIDDDLEEKELRVALAGIASAGLFLFFSFVPLSASYRVPLAVLTGMVGFVFFMISVNEIERRGRAITKFRERPSRMREILADLEHDQWVKLTKYYANQDDEIQVSEEKLHYWKDLWVDYEELSEEMKDKDRKYADKVIEALEEVDYY
jgi:hypothetical protein